MSAAWILNTLADETASSTWLSDNFAWLLAAAFVFIGLFIVGFRDVIRFSWTRTWAISGVCFAESIRKKVLWITPLAIFGIIAVTQFEHAADQRDAIHQTVKYSLFATGMVVILTSIILACTNLPKEIESKVIFTVVTKPTTRLELILGKVIGFSRVSLTILIIMGLFTWGYLRLREQEKKGEIARRLAEGDLALPNEIACRTIRRTACFCPRRMLCRTGGRFMAGTAALKAKRRSSATMATKS